MEILKIVSGPILGSVIGFGTNYIAIKMLFRPYKEVKVFGKRLPFTPGIIPKRKPEIAKAIGGAVGNELFTKEDIQKMLLSEEIEKNLSDKIIEGLKENDKSIKENLLSILNESKYYSGKISLEEAITSKIQGAIMKLDLGTLIANEAGSAIKKEISNPLVKMFLSDNMIESLAKPIGQRLKEYVMGNGKEFIFEAVDNEVKNVEDTNLSEVIEKLNIEEEKIREIISSFYKKIASEVLDKILENFDIAKIVEEKVNEMSVKDLEKLILKITKRELNTIISLGGILGFLIGLLNILVVL
jgi:uncharacterized membrane protein YheB (UPF0754 family)